MPPSAESNVFIPLRSSAPTKNVTFAVNYEVQMVDAFLASGKRAVTEASVLNSTAATVETQDSAKSKSNPSTHRRAASNMENDVPMSPNVPGTETNNISSISAPQQQHQHTKRAAVLSPDTTRRSAREKKEREIPLARSRVRYDMQLVPPARRHRPFLQTFPSWWLQEHQEDTSQPRRSSRLTVGTTSTCAAETKAPPACTQCDAPRLPPFTEDTSVVWIPSKRSEWEDTVSEMTAVCTSAALRQYLAAKDTTKPFHAPLSRDYIRDRVDIDDPLNGFQIRHKAGGWLQGFIMWTNFTTWTHYFKFDSLHAMSGMVAAADDANTNAATSACSGGGNKVDADGSLSAQLEAQPRAGDPHVGGIVFEGIAEISLVGGLGCGEYALRMALEDIRSKNTYKYVVLQATNASKTFYERFGFVQVGAVCRYLAEGQEAEIMGYRHWTHANESESSLHLHGGPSYMMCLKLPELQEDSCSFCGRPCAELQKPSFLEEMLALAVEQKPTIEQLGAASTPCPKNGKRNGAVATPTGELMFASGGKRKYGRRSSGVGARRKSNTSSPVPASATTAIPGAATAAAKPGAKRPGQTNIRVEPANKRRKLDGRSESRPADHLFSSPKDSKPLSYAQKQYQSVWLAVPPTAGTKGSRTAPKDRSTLDGHDTTHPSFTKKNSKKKALPGKGLTPSARPAYQQPVGSAVSKNIDTPLGSENIGTRGVPASPEASDTPVSIDKTVLIKQKVRSYPRSRIHFFNKVVKLKKGHAGEYFFVLHYDEQHGRVRIVPMVARGKLSGKREGRPRYQTIIEDTDSNFRSFTVADIDLVKAAMVMKTPVIASEAWDIEE